MPFSAAAAEKHIVRSAAGGLIRTLDPIQADDLASRNLLGAIFDTLLEYEYSAARPYKLKPSMLSKMPECDQNYSVYRFSLRDDLYFADNDIFGGKKRRITVDDVFFSLKRIADARNHSPVYWIIKNKIKGIGEFNRITAKYEKDDMTPYDFNVEGMVKKSDFEFELHLETPDPRFLYLLAMPNTAVVPREAVQKYGADFARHPVGSGPFTLRMWRNNYKIIFDKNPLFRKEIFAGAENPLDRSRTLPLADSVEIWLVRQPMTAWLLFLRGEIDLSALDKDNLDLAVVNGKLSAALETRGVKLLQNPEFEIRYIGFNFNDPVLGENLELRKALSLAYDVERRVEFTNHQMVAAQGPIPPGVAGFRNSLKNPFASADIEKAKKHLAAAGYPDGINPENGERLSLTFDQSGNSNLHRQFGELAVADFAKIGITTESVLNNKPRFFDKLRRGNVKLFRLSWVGDYPDAENFLQLFYSENIGGCNRTGFSDPEFDRRFREILPMADSPERTKLYEEMVDYLVQKCVWIYEGFPISNQLCHKWLENYITHDFAFSRWKFLTVNNGIRSELKSQFTPLSFKEAAGPKNIPTVEK
jgi:ABC-type transport system substrate-binding protein